MAIRSDTQIRDVMPPDISHHLIDDNWRKETLDLGELQLPEIENVGLSVEALQYLQLDESVTATGIEADLKYTDVELERHDQRWHDAGLSALLQSNTAR